MAVDKKIDYVEQDGYKNYIKNSKSVTVPKEFKSRSDATPTKLAYITKDEAKMLKKMKKNTPHKGPKGIPSYDDYDAGKFTSGAAMSAAESGKNTSDTLAAGMTGKDVQDIRSSVIAAGAGQRVNPGFFDSRNTVSADELAAARAFNPRAFRQSRGGIMGLIGSGGILGNIIRGIGQRFGLGKRFDEPTYDMRGLSSVNPNNLDIYNEFVEDDEEDTNILVPKRKPDGTITNTRYPGEDKNFYTDSFDLMSTGVQDGPYRKAYGYLEGDLYKDNTKRREPITFRSSYPNVNTGGILNTDAFISTDGLGDMDG
tara:strand:+ start:57 stop:992 length:936 start_codon:yes stop_codon:yes gene_type:complete